MTNVEMVRNGNILTIVVDLSVKGEMSKSGKSIVLASTLGNKKIEADDKLDNGQAIFIGLNVYKQ
jgi:hypothetical protein